MPGIGVITNPRSRANKKDPSKMRQLAYLLGSRGAANATRSLDDLHRAAEEFKAAEIDILGINGGDGTIHVTLSAFAKVYGDAPLPKIALLGGGTLNTIARGLGVSGVTEKLLYDVIERYHAEEPFETITRNVMRIGDRVGFLFGNGLLANYLTAYYATGKPSPMTGLTTMLRFVGSAMINGKFIRAMTKPWRGQVDADGERWAREEFLTICAATVPEIGLGFAPFYRCTEKPGHFAMLGIHCKPLSLVRELPRIWRAKPIRRDKCISAVVADVTIRAEQPWKYMIDGDMYECPGELSVSTGPEVSIIRPNP